MDRICFISIGMILSGKGVTFLPRHVCLQDQSIVTDESAQSFVYNKKQFKLRGDLYLGICFYALYYWKCAIYTCCRISHYGKSGLIRYQLKDLSEN